MYFFGNERCLLQLAMYVSTKAMFIRGQTQISLSNKCHLIKKILKCLEQSNSLKKGGKNDKYK